MEQMFAKFYPGADDGLRKKFSLALKVHDSAVVWNDVSQDDARMSRCRWLDCRVTSCDIELAH